jgi:hypothetical protein
MRYEWPFQRNLVPPHGVTSQWDTFVAHIFHITSWKQPIFNSQCHIDVSGFQNVHPEMVHVGYGQFLDIAVFSLSFRLFVNICTVPHLYCLQWEHMQAVDAQAFQPLTCYIIIRAESTLTLWKCKVDALNVSKGLYQFLTSVSFHKHHWLSCITATKQCLTFTNFNVDIAS